MAESLFPLIDWWWLQGQGPGPHRGYPYLTHMTHPPTEMFLSGVASSDPMPAIPAIMGLITLKDAAAHLANEPAKSQLLGRIDASIEKFLDDYCGTPHGPWPGPGPWVYTIASQLSVIGNTLQEGSLRTEILKLAGKVLERGLATGPEHSG